MAVQLFNGASPLKINQGLKAGVKRKLGYLSASAQSDFS